MYYSAKVNGDISNATESVLTLKSQHTVEGKLFHVAQTIPAQIAQPFFFAENMEGESEDEGCVGSLVYSVDSGGSIEFGYAVHGPTNTYSVTTPSNIAATATGVPTGPIAEVAYGLIPNS